MAKKKFYAVAVGRQRGIFNSWGECEKQVHGFPKAKFKGFTTLQEAQNFLGIFESANGSRAPKEVEPAKRPLQEEKEAQEQKRPAAKRPHVQKSPQASNISSNWQVFIGFDGGARGNPGVAGAGAEVVITERTPKNVQKHRRKIHLRTFVGTSATCNMAEWQGVLSGLKEVVKQVEIFNKKNDPIKPQIELVVQGDSQLVIRQLDGTYTVRNPGLKNLKKEFDAALKKLKELTSASLSISYEHVYRVDNKVADGLANEAMDAKRTWTTLTVDSSDDEDFDESEHGEDSPPAAGDKSQKVYVEV